MRLVLGGSVAIAEAKENARIEHHRALRRVMTAGMKDDTEHRPQLESSPAAASAEDRP